MAWMAKVSAFGLTGRMSTIARSSRLTGAGDRREDTVEEYRRQSHYVSATSDAILDTQRGRGAWVDLRIGQIGLSFIEVEAQTTANGIGKRTSARVCRSSTAHQRQ